MNIICSFDAQKINSWQQVTWSQVRVLELQVQVQQLQIGTSVQLKVPSLPCTAVIGGNGFCKSSV